MNEQEMRKSKVPKIHSIKKLTTYIKSLEEQEHDYGTCVYAMSMSAVAAFNYIAHKLRATGFQASCADLDIIRRIRNLKVFMIVDFSNALYPQYNLVDSLQKSLDENRGWLAEEAKKLLKTQSKSTSSKVIAHWKKLAGEND